MPRGVVVIGASAGGVDALLSLAGRLPADFAAPILVCQHIGPHRSILPELMAARGALPAAHAQDGEALEDGRIHVAPPDVHMLVEGDRIALHRGPKENHTRPAIDPLFTTAALSHGAGVAGVVLSGRLDDGTAGLQAIKECGGMAIVQDPGEAEEPSMPRSAMRYVPVDHCARLEAIVPLLEAFARDAASRQPQRCDVARLLHERALFEGQGDPVSHLEAIGRPTTFVCPDCKGGLWEVRDSMPVRFRCHTGHAFTLRTLQFAQSEQTDAALWGALRALQEKELLLRRLATMRGADELEPSDLNSRADDVEARARRLRELIDPK